MLLRFSKSVEGYRLRQGTPNETCVLLNDTGEEITISFHENSHVDVESVSLPPVSSRTLWCAPYIGGWKLMGMRNESLR